jgi:8-oxo-dGTP diphosphatase
MLPEASPMERVDLAQALVQDDEGRVLLLLSRNGEWELPGGRREAGETLREAAIREVKQKVGLTVEVERVAAIGEFLTRLSNVHNLFVVFAVKSMEGEAAIQPDEDTEEDILELRWATLEEADYLVTAFPGGVRRLAERKDTVYYALEGFE